MEWDRRNARRNSALPQPLKGSGETPFPVIERTFNRLDHRKIELDRRRSVPARVVKDTLGADIETRVCQPPAHGGRKLVEPVNPDRALIKCCAAHLPAIEHGHPLGTPNRVELDGHGFHPSKVVRSFGVTSSTVASERPNDLLAGIFRGSA